MNQESKQIHILMYGITLCGRTDAPVKWPLGHFWVGVSSKNEATCGPCKAAIQKEARDEQHA